MPSVGMPYYQRERDRETEREWERDRERERLKKNSIDKREIGIEISMSS